MNVAVKDGLMIGGISGLDHRSISPFKDLKIRILDHENFKQVLSWLFALGYAWSDDKDTQKQLYYGVLPEYLYASHDANLYFSVDDDEEHKEVGSLYVQSMLFDKANQAKGK
jgi:hypothetical protein